MILELKTYKLALGVEYDGSDFYGWQSQQKLCTIQENLENALSKVANHEIRVFCAGRTDAGVHSTGQVVHFETTSNRTMAAWTFGVNSYLCKNISVKWVRLVPGIFHARFSAIARQYRYVIYNQSLRPAILSKGLTHFSHILDVSNMRFAGQCLLGENDFTSFRAVDCQSHTPWRNIMYFNVIRQGIYVIIDIKANAFVRHMVRNIVGSLIEIGCGNKPNEWMKEVLSSKDRTLAGPTAKPNGLYLVAVDYPPYFNLPSSSIKPFFLPINS